MSYAEILEHSLQINEDIKNGIKDVPIMAYQTVLNAYIDTLYMLDGSQDRFDKVVEMFGVNINNKRGG